MPQFEGRQLVAQNDGRELAVGSRLPVAKLEFNGERTIAYFGTLSESRPTVAMVPVDIARYRWCVTTSLSLRDLRRAAGISQRELSRRSGVAQPNIAAYETGRRAPAPETWERLMLSLTMPTVSSLREQRDHILEAATVRRLTDVRVFGSVARGNARATSDVDLVVHPADDASVFDLAGFMADVEELVGRRVDVVSDRGSGPTMTRILAEAIPI